MVGTVLDMNTDIMAKEMQLQEVKCKPSVGEHKYQPQISSIVEVTTLQNH